MKKLLMGIFGLTLLLPLGVSAGGADTGGVNLDTTERAAATDATVGEVDVPIYNVDINWHPMVFEWKYNSVEEKYEWLVAPVCSRYYIENEDIYLGSIHTLYRDSSCSTISEGYDEAITDYYFKSTPFEDGSSYISIHDYSTNVKIIPEVTWTSSSGYEYVEGKFSYRALKCTLITYEEVVIDQFGTYSDSQCKNFVNDEEVINTYEPGKYYNYQIDYVPLSSSEIPDDGRLTFGTATYSLMLKLENKEKPTTTPTTGDTIGTITISIKAAE